jgi:HEAT repeat protein
MKNELREKLAVLLSSEDPSLRRRAAEDLAETKGFTPIAALAAALRDENKGVRDSALRSLSKIGSENVAHAAVEYIADENIVTRNLAAELLLKLKDSSIGALLPYLYDVNQDVRKFAVDILGLIGNEQTVDHILPLLDDPDENVVVSAAEALGNIRSPRAVPHLIRIFKLHDFAKMTVGEALGKIGGDNAGEFLLKYFSAMVSRQDIDILVLYAVADSIALIGTEDALPILRKSLQTVKGCVRHVLLHAMVKILERHRRPFSELEDLQGELVEALACDNNAVKLSAVVALADMDGLEVTMALLKIVGIAEELDAVLFPILLRRRETFAAVVELAGLGRIVPSEEIISLIGKISAGVDYHALSPQLLDQQLDLLRRAFDFVTTAWKDGNEEVRSALIDTMFRLDGDRAFEYLSKVTEEPDPWLRIHVIELVAPLGNRGISDFIVRFLADDDGMVRDVAAATLASRESNPRLASAAPSPIDHS